MRRFDKGWMNTYWLDAPFNRVVGRGQSSGHSEGTFTCELSYLAVRLPVNSDPAMTQSSTAPRRRQFYVADPNPLGRHRSRIRSSIDGWPTESAGDKHLLLKTPASESLRTRDRLEMYLGSVKSRPETPLSTVEQSVIRRRNNVARTSVEAYRNEKEWADGLEATLINRNGLGDLAIACKTGNERDLVQCLLQGMLAAHEDDFDLLGLKLPQAAVFLIEDLVIQQYRELFVAPGINPATASREQLEIVLHAPRVGLHLVPFPFGLPA